MASNDWRNLTRIGLGHLWSSLYLPNRWKSLIDVDWIEGSTSDNAGRNLCSSFFDLVDLGVLFGHSSIP